MAKKHTAAYLKDVIRFILLGAFEHIEALKTEIRKIGPIDDTTDEKVIHRAKMLNLSLIAINDIIHPAHHLCSSILGKENDDYFKALEKSFKLLVEKKMINNCFCVACDPDKSKSQAYIDKLEKAQMQPDDSVGEA